MSECPRINASLIWYFCLIRLIKLIKEKIGKLRLLKEKRGNIDQYIDKIAQKATTNENLLPHIIEAVNAKVSLGEICNSLRNVWGEYRPKDII